ncbi:hypothetical protein LCGC14_2161660, partial [marine sediment metagenome]
IIILSIFGIIFFFTYKHFQVFWSFNNRIVVWKQIIEGWRLAPFFGHGLGSFYIKEYVHCYSLTRWAHSVPLDILHNGGIVLLVLVSGYFIDLFRRVFIIEKDMFIVGFTTALLTLILVCVVNSLIAPIYLLGIIYIAGLEISLSRRRVYE